MNKLQTWLWIWRIRRAIPEVKRLAKQHPDDLAYSIHDAKNALSVFEEFSSQAPRILRTGAEEGELVEVLFLLRWRAQELTHQAKKNQRVASLLRRWRPQSARKKGSTERCPFCALFGQEPEPLDTDFFGEPKYIGDQRACYACAVVAEGQEEDLLQRLKTNRPFPS